MKTSKLGTDFIGFVRATIIGLMGAAIYLYSSYQGTTGAGMKFAKTFSVAFIIMGICGMILTKLFEKHPIKSIGVVNKDDEMLKLIRYRAAYTTFEITVSAIIIFTILTAAEVIRLNMPIYIIGIIFVVTMEIINIIFITIYSNRMM